MDFEKQKQLRDQFAPILDRYADDEVLLEAFEGSLILSRIRSTLNIPPSRGTGCW
jgi:hypothetical protein